MANTDKNILITPNVGQEDEPRIDFTGADNNPVSLKVLDSGALSFEGSNGQLFSIADENSGTVFSVNDISGIPSIEVEDTGTIKLAEFGGNVGIGTANPTAKLHVTGDAFLNGIVVGKGGGNQSNNTAVGRDSLSQNTTGSNNTAVGRNTLELNTTGSSNTAIGMSALSDITTGSSNTALGAFSLSNTTTSLGNTAVGTLSMSANTTGADNTAVGLFSLSGNTTGSRNVAVGRNALSELTTGSNNTAIGRYNGNQAGIDIRTSSNNILLSDGNGNVSFWKDETGNIKLLTGNAEKLRLTSEGRLGIGTSFPSYNLHVNAGDGSNTTEFISRFTSNLSNGNSAMRFRAHNNKFTIISEESDSLVLGSNNNEVVTIANDGNVGIGVASPTAKLHVNGSTLITGDLTVNGTTTSVNSTVTTINDPVITLGDDSPSSSDSKDRGIEFKYGDGSNVKTGFFGMDRGDSRFKFIPDASNSSEDFSGSLGEIQASKFIGELVGSASKLTTARTIALSGNVSGSVTFDGSQDVTINTNTDKLAKQEIASVNLEKGQYKRVARINDDRLASTVRFSATGTTPNAVVGVICDVICNHAGDIQLTSNSGDYVPLDIKIISNGNEDFDLYLKYEGDQIVGDILPLDLVVFPLSGGTVTSNPTQPEFDTTTLEQNTGTSKITYSQSSGDVDIETDGSLTTGGDITVDSGIITLGGTGRIQGIDTVSDLTDAANKSYVDFEIRTKATRKHDINIASFSGQESYIRLFTLNGLDEEFGAHGDVIVSAFGDYADFDRTSLRIIAGQRGANGVNCDVYSLNREDVVDPPQIFTKLISDVVFEVWMKVSDFNVQGKMIEFGTSGFTANVDSVTTTEPSGLNPVVIHSQYSDQYHPNSDKLTTARTISLSGDASGSVSFDGSQDVSIPVTVENDSHNHTSNSGNYTVGGDLTVNGGDIILQGAGHIRGVDIVSADTDATNKAYVDAATESAKASTVQVITSNKTISSTDEYKVLYFKNTSDITVTLPDAASVPTGFNFKIANAGLAKVTFVTSGGDVINNSKTTFDLFGGAELHKVSNDEYLIIE